MTSLTPELFDAMVAKIKAASHYDCAGCNAPSDDRKGWVGIARPGYRTEFYCPKCAALLPDPSK